MDGEQNEWLISGDGDTLWGPLLTSPFTFIFKVVAFFLFFFFFT